MTLYTELILDHYKNPQNYGTLKNPTVSVEEKNPLCGDNIRLDFQIGKDGRVEKVGWQGAGCAISLAAMSMLSEKLIGMHIKNIEKIKSDEIFAMLGGEISAGRVKCALLGLSAAKKAIQSKK